jgi:hypothetical protein
MEGLHVVVVVDADACDVEHAAVLWPHRRGFDHAVYSPAPNVSTKLHLLLDTILQHAGGRDLDLVTGPRRNSRDRNVRFLR